ncbi:MAG: methyltransferase domain-containing protein [Gammaproteobacteria bacterium]|nr:methyltransferase domain-containing protein [Gammaproteobacteria bacterium]
MKFAKESAGHWSRYWRTGALHACVSGESGGIFSEDFWKDFFAGVEGPVRLLDIGTGNGLIPLLATRYLGGRARIHGIDAAQIHPGAARHPELADVEFMSGVAAEHLPLDNSSIDVVSSQFALEYSDIASSLDEVLRVLSPAGQLAFVMHARDSRISTVSRAQLRQIEWLRTSGGFFDSARGMIQVLESRRDTGSDRGSHALARQRYNDVAMALIRRLERENDGDVLARAAIAVQRTLAACVAGTEAGEIDRLERMVEELDDEASRLREQLDAARTPEQVREIRHRLEIAGMDVVTDSLHQDGQLIAYTVTARR